VIKALVIPAPIPWCWQWTLIQVQKVY